MNLTDYRICGFNEWGSVRPLNNTIYHRLDDAVRASLGYSEDSFIQYRDPGEWKFLLTVKLNDLEEVPINV